MASAPQASIERLRAEAASSHPAWLFAPDGTLIWRNRASGYFAARSKKSGLRIAPVAQPIKGQVARVLRLGSVGRTSLSRMQFLAGDKPISATCACTPLAWETDTALLVVGVDAIAPEILSSGLAADPAPLAGVDEDLDAAPQDRVSEEPEPLPFTPPMIDPLQPHVEPGEDDPQAQAVARDAPEFADPSRHEADVEAGADAETAQAADVEPDPAGRDQVEPTEEAEPDDAEDTDAAMGRLSSLMDRMMADERLFGPVEAEPTEAVPDPQWQAERHADPESEAEPDPAPGETRPALSRVIGRYLRAPADEDIVAVSPGAIEPDQAGRPLERARAELIEPADDPGPVADPSQVERVSRYNFDELARILTDRVGERNNEAEKLATAPAGSVLAGQERSSGALINLGGETLVLNRLPLGIVVFRDQTVLFANRAVTEMIGYESVEMLRAAGLGAIFPGQDDAAAGPVNHLVARDGTLVPVTARLQSVSWQGRPALMLSASATEVRTGHEGAVKAFAESLSALADVGFLETNRAGIIGAVNAAALAMIGGKQTDHIGRPLLDLVDPAAHGTLREFLERPARFAETERPALRIGAAAPNVELALFAQGQAGLVTGYFGFTIATGESASTPTLGGSEIDSGVVARLSRGLRRPLNTIIGFADLIASDAFGPIDNPRYGDYARDIKSAGEDIAALVDELEDFARLRDGRYLPQRASLDLLGLLESCLMRTRPQAGLKRVIVRTALSASLPRVTADRASLTQAILNLIASAIDQTPVGGAVVLSAQLADDGGITINVRDNSENAADLSERFVVFRDGTGKTGKALAPVRSSVGLALTRSLLAVNAVSLSVDPAGQKGLLFSLHIPADLVERG